MKTFRLFLTAASLLAAAGAALAATVTGRVTDAANRIALEGARVAIEGTPLVAITDRFGEYRIEGAPTGPINVTVNYLGYPALAELITVIPGQVATVNFAFGAVGAPVRLAELTVTGMLIGQARALNEQRAAETLTNIVSADAIGQFPDRNVAEALQRVPGVALYRDQGEGRYAILRGISSTFTGVRVNGATMASPDKGERWVPLDVIPSDAVGALEVSKVPTPDISAQGLAGSINLRTKSPFDTDGRFAQLAVQGIYSEMFDQYSGKIDGTYSNVLDLGGGRKFGYLLAPTWERRKFGSFNYEEDGEWSPLTSPAGGTFQFFNGIAFREYQIDRTRWGLSGALEYRPDRETIVYFRGVYNSFDDDELRWATVVPFAEGTGANLQMLGEGTAQTNLRRVRRDLRLRKKEQDARSMIVGFETEQGPWKLDGKIAYSKGTERRSNQITFRFRTEGRTVMRYDFTSPYDVRVTALSDININDPANYSFNRAEIVNETADDTEWTMEGNARYNFKVGDTPAWVKVGAQFRPKTKSQNENVDRFVPGAAANFTFANFNEPSPIYPYFGGPRVAPASGPALLDRLGLFTLQPQLLATLGDDWTTEERVTSGYVMGGASFGPLTASAGVRLEGTKINTTGNSFLVAAGGTPTFAGAVGRSASYSNVLPGLFLRYDATKDLVLRASISSALGRPEFALNSHRYEIDTTANEVLIGTPGLKALEATNLDVSAEYYLPSLGTISVAGFHKSIKNFTYLRRAATLGTNPLFPTFFEVTPTNGDTGRITGIELAYQQQLSFLPAPFDGLGLFANATFADSQATYPTRPGEELPFVGQSNVVYNLALSYEKFGFFGRVAGNFRGKSLRLDEPLGSSVFGDRYEDSSFRLDASASYEVVRGVRVFAEWNNITNEPFRVYFGGPGRKRLAQFEEYGWTANFGVRWTL